VELRGGGLCDYTLLDLNGRTVASGSFDEKTTLSVESLPAGVYALRVLDSRGGQYGLKVIR